MPFDMADMSSLPSFLRKYWPLVEECFREPQIPEKEQKEKRELQRSSQEEEIWERAWKEAEKQGRKSVVSVAASLRPLSCGSDVVAGYNADVLFCVRALLTCAQHLI